MYLLLQMSYSLTSHNFGLSLLGYGYTNLIFNTLILIGIIVFVKTIPKVRINIIFFYTLYQLVYQKYHTKVLKTNYIIITYLVYSSITLFLLSYNPIINNIVNVNFNIDIFNSILNTLNTKTLIIMVLITFVAQFNIILVLVFITYNFSHLNNYTVPLVLYTLKTHICNKLLHTLFIIKLSLVTSMLSTSLIF